MNIVAIDRRIGDYPAAKVLLRKLIEKPKGYKVAYAQALKQCCSARLIELHFAVWEDGRLFLNEQLRDELRR